MPSNYLERFYKNKERGYRLTFAGEPAKDVLADLRVFCYATKPTFSSDPLEMARREGRRETFNRIMTFLKVDFDAIYNMEEDYPND